MSFFPATLSPIPCVHPSYQLLPQCFSPSPLPFYSFWNHLGSSWTRFPYQVNEYLYQRGRVLQDLERIITQSKQSWGNRELLSNKSSTLLSVYTQISCTLQWMLWRQWPSVSMTSPLIFDEPRGDMQGYSDLYILLYYIIFLQNVSVDVYGRTQSC